MSKKLFLYSLFVSIGLAKSAQIAQIVPNAYIVEFDDTADPSAILSRFDAVKTMDLNFTLFRGVSVLFHSDTKSVNEQVNQLMSDSAVKNVWPNKLIPRPDGQVYWTASPDLVGNRPGHDKRDNPNDTFSPHIQTQVDKLRARGITGKGVKIAVIDTGVDYKHPALGNGCYGSADCLFIGGYDFVGDQFNGTNTAVPDNDPYDNCSGHGTHTSGIIAAQKNRFGFTGAAPDAKLAMYRVFGCTGFTTDDILIAAFMRAYDEGANLITASIGEDSGWGEYKTNVAVSRIVEKGIPVTVSAGNDGESGIFLASAPAGGNGVAAIASVDNTALPLLSTRSRYAIGDDEEKDFEYILGMPRNWTGVKLPLWAPSHNTNGTAALGCDPYPDSTPDLSHKILLIRRGGCRFQQKSQNAAARGAKYIMFYNDPIAPINIEVEVTNISAVGLIDAGLGATWINSLAAEKKVVLDMSDPAISLKVSSIVNNSTGNTPSFYTSMGPSFEGDVTPQFGTPGGNILSTWPVALGSYAVLNGTSMAAPLAAGIYALVSSVRKTYNPVVLLNVLSATAKPVHLNVNGITSPLLAPIAQQGGGILQAFDAAYATTILSVSSIAFNDTVHLTGKNFTILNTAEKAVTYELGVLGAATAYTFSNSTTPDPFPGLLLDDSYATLKLSEHKITIPAGGESTIRVEVTAPSIDPARLPVYGGYISLNATNGERLTLPYQGIVGDMSAHRVLNDTYVSNTIDPNAAPVGSGNNTFLLSQNNNTSNDTDIMPLAVLDMTFGSPLANVEVLSVRNASNSAGFIMGSPITFLTRGQNSVSWNGQLDNKTFAAAGTYKFRVSALRIYGDTKDKRDYDVAESDTFTINYK